jgi:hypothetical protein
MHLCTILALKYISPILPSSKFLQYITVHSIAVRCFQQDCTFSFAENSELQALMGERHRHAGGIIHLF